MYSSTTLDIRGHRGDAVPNTFFAQDSETHHLAFVFPKLGYTAHMMPVLYYPRLLLERGADVLLVEYDYREQANLRMPRNPERNRWFFDDVAAACEAGLGQLPYSGVTFVGKSLATLAMGYLLTENTRLAQAQCVWLTPLLRNDRLRAQMRRARGHSLFVMGTADGHYDPAYLDEVRLASGAERDDTGRRSQLGDRGRHGWINPRRRADRKGDTTVSRPLSREVLRGAASAALHGHPLCSRRVGLPARRPPQMCGRRRRIRPPHGRLGSVLSQLACTH